MSEIHIEVFTTLFVSDVRQKKMFTVALTLSLYVIECINIGIIIYLLLKFHYIGKSYSNKYLNYKS